MSKNKKTDDSQQTAEEPTVEAPQTETPEVETPTAPTDYTCPVCKHTTGIKIGAPYEKGDQTLQYVKCEKCEHLGVDVL